MPEDQVSTTPDVLSLAVAGVYSVEQFMYIAGADSWEWGGGGRLTFSFKTYAARFGGRTFIRLDDDEGPHTRVDIVGRAPWSRQAVPA